MNNPETTINFDKLLPKPEILEKTFKLTGKITAWTRSRIDQSGIMNLQNSVNQLYETALQYDDQIHNPESDLHCKILSQAEDVRKEFEKLKSREVKEKITDIARTLEKTKQKYTSNGTTGIACMLHAKKNGNNNFREILDIIGIQDFPVEETFLENLSKQKDELKNTIQKLTEYAILLQEDTIMKYRAQSLTQNLYVIALLNHITNKFLKLKKKMEVPETKTDWNAIEKNVEKDLGILSKILPELSEEIKKRRIEFLNNETPETHEKKREEIERWLEKNMSKEGKKLEIHHNFISEAEREKLEKKFGGSDYSDYVKITITTTGGSTDIFISEMLGVRSISRDPNAPVHFRIAEITGKNPLTKTIPTWERDENFYHTAKICGHVDGEYRQYQAELSGVSQKETKSLISSILELFHPENPDK